MGNNKALVSAIVNDFFGTLKSGGLDIGELYDKVSDYAHKKEPGDDGNYYVNKSEILRATGLSKEEYKDFVYSCRVYGYMEPTGAWFRLKAIPTLGSSSSVTAPIGGQGMLVSVAAGSPVDPGFLSLPTQDYDPSGPSEGACYYNTKLNEMRVFINGQWMAMAMAPATPCP